jgi:hypothetical protein
VINNARIGFSPSALAVANKSNVAQKEQTAIRVGIAEKSSVNECGIK